MKSTDLDLGVGIGGRSHAFLRSFEYAASHFRFLASCCCPRLSKISSDKIYLTESLFELSVGPNNVCGKSEIKILPKRHCSQRAPSPPPPPAVALHHLAGSLSTLSADACGHSVALRIAYRHCRLAHRLQTLRHPMLRLRTPSAVA